MSRLPFNPCHNSLFSQSLYGRVAQTFREAELRVAPRGPEKLIFSQRDWGLAELAELGLPLLGFVRLGNSPDVHCYHGMEIDLFPSPIRFMLPIADE